MITTQMIERLYFADLVLADMTIPNDNVHYEVGLRHAAKENRLRAPRGRLVEGAFRRRPDADPALSSAGGQHCGVDRGEDPGCDQEADRQLVSLQTKDRSHMRETFASGRSSEAAGVRSRWLRADQAFVTPVTDKSGKLWSPSDARG
jgi:hypothetical protein